MVKEYVCERISHPIRIDGILDEAEWSMVSAIKEFVSCIDGNPDVTKTEARICWDEERLYVAFKCYDSEIQSTFRNRDDPIYEEEVVEVFIDPNCNMKSYYEINVSPLNVVYDALIFNPKGTRSGMKVDVEWNCEGIETAVKIHLDQAEKERKNQFWTVEMAIPFKSLSEAPSIPPHDGDIWRVNLYRIERSPKPEFISWSPTLRPDFHVPSAFGRLIFKE